MDGGGVRKGECEGGGGGIRCLVREQGVWLRKAGLEWREVMKGEESERRNGGGGEK